MLAESDARRELVMLSNSGSSRSSSFSLMCSCTSLEPIAGSLLRRLLDWSFLARRCPPSLFLFVKALLHERLQKGLVADIPASGQCFQAPERKIVEANVDRFGPRARTLLLGGLFCVLQEVFRYAMLL